MLYEEIMRPRARIHVIELRLLINYYFDTLREGCSNVISAILAIQTLGNIVHKNVKRYKRNCESLGNT